MFDILLENLGETPDLACEMFTSGLRPCHRMLKLSNMNIWTHIMTNVLSRRSLGHTYNSFLDRPLKSLIYTSRGRAALLPPRYDH